MEKSKNTLSYLNSKWYWRLIKVIGLLFYILVFICSSIWIYLYFSSYNPVKLEKVKNIIKEKSLILKQLETIETKIPWKELKLNDLKKIIWKEYLNNINSIAINFVMIEFLWKEISQIQVCGRDLILGCSWEYIWTYIKDSINDEKYDFVIELNNDTYIDAKDTFEEYYKIEKDAIDWINNMISWKSTREWSVFNDFDNKNATNINSIIWKEYEYRTIIDYLKIISSILWVLIWIVIFNFILLRIIYYIVLWQIFPKKD